MLATGGTLVVSSGYLQQATASKIALPQGAAEHPTPAAPGVTKSVRPKTSRRPSTTTTTAPTTTTTLGPRTPQLSETVPPSLAPLAAALLARLKPVMGRIDGCLVVTDGNDVLYQHQPAASFSPASTQKLLVAVAALKVLGPNYRYTTKVVAPAHPVDGRVSKLWLVGGGDPLLATKAFSSWWASQPRYLGDPMTPFNTLVAAVLKAGVRSVPGGIAGDDSRYDSQRINPDWPADDVTEHDISPLSALTLNEGFQTWMQNALVPTDPAWFAATTMAQYLHTDHVAITPKGDPDSQPPAKSVVIAEIQSAPLWQIIDEMETSSDDQTAELLVKELGYHHSGLGTTAGGLAVVKSVDQSLGIPWAGVHLVDGSGLSPDDRSTCSAELAAMNMAQEPGFGPIVSGMPLAGRTGTLLGRFENPPLVDNLRAKTGSIQNAGGIVGRFDVRQLIRFAFLNNQPMSASDSQLYVNEDNVIQAILEAVLHPTKPHVRAKPGKTKSTGP